MNNTIYTDQKGNFPVIYQRGHKYLMIMCEVDINSILAELTKNKILKEMIRIYKTIQNQIK